MTIQSTNYIPCLRWKQGEYQAIYRLSATTKQRIIPLIEVAEIGYDFETGQYIKSLDTHINYFVKRIMDKWGTGKCFIDMKNIEQFGSLENGTHPLSYIFNNLRNKKASAIPVIGINIKSDLLSTVQKILDVDKRGVCIRVNVEELARNSYASNINSLLDVLKIKMENCDLIIDLRFPNFEPINDFAQLLTTLIGNIPSINSWRIIGLIGTSFPQTLGGISYGLSTLKRSEWCLYKVLVNRLNEMNYRIPIYGDYSINFPDQNQLDMRIIKPSASIRYSIADKWLIAKGKNVRDNGYSQYKGLCEQIISSGNYSGKNFSAGDEYIFTCAYSASNRGNLSTWRFVGTNHHIETVIKDLANLHVS